MKAITASLPSPAPPTSDGFAPARELGAAAQGRKLPDFGERSRAFMLGAHYSSWELVETSKGWRLVPTLKRLILKAGVNWTPTAGKGKSLDRSHLEARARARWDFTVLTDMAEYLVEVDGAERPGIFLRWERVRTYGDGKFSVSMDADGYDLWRWSLVTDQRIEPPRDDVVGEIRLRLRRQKDRATRTPHLAQAQRAEAEADKRMRGLEEALKALKAPPQQDAESPAPAETAPVNARAAAKLKDVEAENVKLKDQLAALKKEVEAQLAALKKEVEAQPAALKGAA